MVPLIMLTAQIFVTIQVLLESPDVISFENQQTSTCFISSLILRVAVAIIPVVIVIHTGRFLLIINLNGMKSLFFSTHKSTRSQLVRIKILKLITAPWFQIALIVCFAFFWILLNIVEMTSVRFNCPQVGIRGYMGVVQAALLAFLWFVGGLELLYDMIANYKLKCNLKKYFITNDVYSYRVEVFWAWLISCGLVIYGLLLALRVIRFPVIPIVYTPLIWLLTICLSVFPLTLTIIWEVKKWFKAPSKTKEDKDLIDKLLGEEPTRSLFIEFSKQEWSLENVMLWVSPKIGVV